MLCSNFPPAIYFTYGNAYVSVLLCLPRGKILYVYIPSIEIHLYTQPITVYDSDLNTSEGTHLSVSPQPGGCLESKPWQSEVIGSLLSFTCQVGKNWCHFGLFSFLKARAKGTWLWHPAPPPPSPPALHTGAAPGLMCFHAEGFVGLFPQSASTSTSKPTRGRTWRGGRCSSSPSTSGLSGHQPSCSRLCKRALTVPTSRSWSSPWSSRAMVARWCQVRPWSGLYEEGNAGDPGSIPGLGRFPGAWHPGVSPKRTAAESGLGDCGQGLSPSARLQGP